MKTVFHKLLQLWRATPEWKRSVLITAFLFLVMIPWTNRVPGFWRYAFVMPTACIASWFMSAECLPTSEGYLITSAIPVHVVLACSGAMFFTLLASLLLGQSLASRRPTTTGLALALLAAYLVTITANSARVVFTGFTDRWADLFLPANFAAATHMGAGFLVFLVFLVITWFLFMKIIDHQRKENQK